MTYQFIHAEEHGKALVLRLDDPETRNALGGEMSRELLTEIARFEKSPDLRCLVLTGTGPSFCSGANLRGMQRGLPQETQRQQPEEMALLPWATPWAAMDALGARGAYRVTDPGRGTETFMPLVLMRLEKPSIAAVNGYARGIGNGIALSCDIRIASEKASFASTFIQRGLIPGDGSCWQLPRMIGLSNTYLFQYTGDPVDAETALRWGLVSKVVPHDQLMKATLELATRLAEGPVYQMGIIKYLVQQSLSVNFEEALQLSGAGNAIARTTFDHREGIQAFIENRPPRFRGR